MSDTRKLLLGENDGGEAYAMMPPDYYQDQAVARPAKRTNTALYVILGLAVACAIIPGAYFLGRHSVTPPAGNTGAGSSGIDAEDLCKVAKPASLDAMPTFSVSNAATASVVEPLPGNLLPGRFLQCFMAVLDNSEISCVPSNPLVTSPGGGQLFLYSNKGSLALIFSLTGPSFGATSGIDTVENMRAAWLHVNVTITLSGKEKNPEAVKVIPFSGPYKQRYESYSFASSKTTVPLEIGLASSNGFIVEMEGMELPAEKLSFKIESDSLPAGVSLDKLPLRATGLNMAPQDFEGVTSFQVSQLDSSLQTSMGEPELEESSVVSGDTSISSLTPAPKRRRAEDQTLVGPKPAFDHGFAIKCGGADLDLNMMLDVNQATSELDLVFDVNHDRLNKTRVAYQMTDVLFDGLHDPTDNQGNMIISQQEYSRVYAADGAERRRGLAGAFKPMSVQLSAIGNGMVAKMAEARAKQMFTANRRRFDFGNLMNDIGGIAGKVAGVACADDHQFFGKAQKCACEGAQLVQGGANCLQSINTVISDGKLEEVLNTGHICGVSVKQACNFFKDCTGNPLPDKVCSFVGARRRRIAALQAPQRRRRGVKVSKTQLACVWNCAPSLIKDSEINDLNHCLSKFGISSKNDVAAFLAQGSHESGGGRWLKELDSGNYLNGRTDLGNVHPGDGPKYKGAGFIQLTGRANYQSFANKMGDARIMDGVNYVADHYPFSSAGFWWQNNHMSSYVNGGASVDQVGARVNGRMPPNGAADRRHYWDRTAHCGIR